MLNTDQLRPGRELSGFRIEAVIGRGGMGSVYLAKQMRLGRRVALKVLLPELASDDEYRARFIRESELAASLEHPNVLPVYDAGEAEGVLYLAMRYVDGRDLRSLLKEQGTLTAGRTLAIVRQVAAALDAAHEAGLVHRDVKPANILIGRKDDVYLSDFGVAKRTASAGLTRTGGFLGTVDYCAPEQIEGGAVDGRADIYSLGCVAFHCLAGQPPFQRETEVAVIKAHLQDPPPALSSVRAGLPLTVDGAIVTAMAKHREVRFQAAGELAAALEQALAAADATPRETVADIAVSPVATNFDASVAPPRVATRPTLRMRRAPKRVWLIAAGAAVVLGAGVVLAEVLAVRGDSGGEALRTSSIAPRAPSTGASSSNNRYEVAPVSSEIAPSLATIGQRQRAVTARVRAIRPGVQSFARLRSASDELATTISRTQGSLDAVDATTPKDESVLGATRDALTVHLAYAKRLKQIPDLPRLFTRAQARGIIAAARTADRAYARLAALEGALPGVDISPDAHMRLLGIVTSPTAQPRYFASIDRLQRCYVTARVARCGSGPSGEVVQLRVGGPAAYVGRVGSQDRGGPALRFGQAVVAPGGAIRCESSSRGITCTDRSSGASFTIGDYRHTLSQPPATTTSAPPPPPRSAVPSTYTGSFTSVDRLQHCYATDTYVRCGSGPSGQVVELRSGVGARYLGVLGSSDNGGPAMPIGAAFNTPSSRIVCESSSRGITCRDGVTGQTFTIGDHYVRVNGVRIAG